MKNLSVSSGKPDPIISSHQPLVGSFADEEACADGDSPVKIITAFSPSPLSSPHVS